ncbi:hypothetical protein AK830_g11038 [Neonectria ditissima]|uniref:U3 small nucleolar RNA-associated protein 14 n=1 Tax=Neonectria ditissima TaxID=78410 RepID=A0A0P7AE50_9HYPO|nr:hypothetical protein AK830_g11038 [Neonectria ditissima]
MGGRQAHGRSLIAAPKPKPNANKKSKARSQKNALDAFGIAQEKFAPKQKQTPRARELDADIEKKHGREDDEEDEEEEEEEPQRKKVKRPVGDDADDGSDSEGNEWRLGGLRDDDEDSEIESDDAFGDSDQEQLQGYTFRGSKSTHKDDDSDDDSQDDQGETLGADAIDLATALDQFEESSKEESNNKNQSASSESDDDASDESEEDDDDDDTEDSEDEQANPEKLEALEGLISGYGGNEPEPKTKSKSKISLSDLGLTGINDQNVKKSLKLMNKEEKETRPGATKKLDIPLARRQQDRLDRSAAYDKTSETLDRWNDTVKQNRRAEHLIFPLAQNSATAGLDTTEIQPLTTKNPSNELEATIMSIMTQSGLSMEKAQKPREKEFDEEGNELSRKEALARKRRERELNSRETKRAARIKKIKSKAYHRVHRRQRERDEMATKEAMDEAGEIDSEEEREAQDRRRALERVGQRHKDSKWAKLGSKGKRAVWDDDFRAGLTEMARKDEELRRRKEGRAGGSDDDFTSDSGSDNGDASLRRQLKELDEDDDEPQSGLMGMKFMQKAEAAKKEANDALVKQIRRDLDGDDAEDSSEEEKEEVGRRKYGAADGKAFTPASESSSRAAKKRRSGNDNDDDDDEVVITTNSSNAAGLNTTAADKSLGTSTAGAWSRGETRRKKKGESNSRIEDLDLTSNVIVASKPVKSKPKSKPTNGTIQDDGDSDASDIDQHLPMAIRDQEMVARAFAGEDVVGEFEREKEEVADADDDKIIDNTLPGWGSWVGEGVSSRELKRHKGRFLTKVEGIKKKNRKDAKLDKVIVNEKRIKKNDRYLASQLPHPFESREQYERSLRLPVGPEWMTKETFQESTKPRVLTKQGIIAPMSKPMI